VLYYHRAIKTVYVVEGWKITVHWPIQRPLHDDT
jgi:hypothetical protein